MWSFTRINTPTHLVVFCGKIAFVMSYTWNNCKYLLHSTIPLSMTKVIVNNGKNICFSVLPNTSTIGDFFNGPVY